MAAATTSKLTPTAQRQRNDMARIHMLKAAAGLSDDDYRSLLISRYSVDSSKQLDAQGRAKLIHHLTMLRDQVAPQTKEHKPAARQRVELTPQQKLLWALWKTAVTQGKFRTGTWSALSAWCKRQTGGEAGVDRVEWLTSAQLSHCIDTMKAITKGER